MKKFLLASLTILLTFCAIGLTACGHEHDYKIQSSSSMHWYKCECGDTIGYDVHAGGEATCKEKAKCSTCGVEYGELGEHTGGEATCKEKAKCSTCGVEYGELGEHTGGEATCNGKMECSTCEKEYGEDVEPGDCKFEKGNCKWCKKEQCEGLLFELINDTEYVVKDIGDFEGRELVIPSIHLGKPVTSIGDYAFDYCDSLTSIEIPDSVTSMGGAAFYNCRSLTSVVIPDSVTSISAGTFQNCRSLEVVEIPNSVTSIGSGAFSGCDLLQTIEIPNSVTSIGYRVFYGCVSLTSITVDENNADYKEIDSNLYSKDGRILIQYAIGKKSTSFTIPDSVTSIGSYAFYGCDLLQTIEIPNSVTSIGDRAFAGCSKLQYNIEGELKYLGNTTNPYLYLADTNSNYIKSATINSKCKFIGSYALSSCYSLTSIEIPNSVANIGDYAFYGCSSLTSIEIPNSVTSIGYDAFYGCSSLQYNLDGGLKYLGNTTNPYLYLADTNSTSITSATINSNCTSIGYSAFSYCTLLKAIEIPDSVTSIGDGAFSSCYSLTSIEIPDSVTSIGYDAFYGCENLTIYCEAESQPDGWDSYWKNGFSAQVVWGYKG